MASSLNSTVKAFVAQKLQEEYPWMSTDVVHESALACGNLVGTKLEEQ